MARNPAPLALTLTGPQDPAPDSPSMSLSLTNPEFVAGPLLRGSVGRVLPTRSKEPLAAGWVGRSGRSDPKFSPPRCARRVGRSGQPESKTQKTRKLTRSVEDAEWTFNFGPPINRLIMVPACVRACVRACVPKCYYSAWAHLLVQVVCGVSHTKYL